MSSNNPIIQEVDEKLSRLACSVVLESSPSARNRIGAEVMALAGRLGASSLAGLERVIELLSVAASKTSDPDAAAQAFAEVDAAWCEWKAAAETVADAAEVSEGCGAAAVDSAPPASLPSIPLDDSPGDEDLEILRTDPELAGMFIGEALDHLGTIEATVLQLEANPEDQKLLNDVFRPFHTIKGNAGALGVKSVQEFAHKVENLLDLGRSGKICIGPAETDVILKSVDLLTTMINDLTARLAGSPAKDVRVTKTELMTVIEHIVRPEAGSPPAPAVATAADAAKRPTGVPEAATPVVTQPQLVVTAPAAATAASLAPTEASKRPAEVVSAASPASPPAGQSGGRRVEDAAAASVKVDTRKLDNLVDMVGELVIVQSIISADPALVGLSDERLSRNLAQLRRITSDLQRNAMSMRMVPIRQTFQKMARLVRDLSKKSGKPLDLVLSGEDTELDRKVVEDINDPLMHMVRNSVDHGIESPEKRAAAGKPANGRISLSAYHQGGNIVIGIADDGKGLDAEKILAKAISQGLVRQGESLSPQEVHQLIFRPGFSTAEKVTEISGRGVGMDVVRRNIEALRGRVEIQTTAGSGTTFHIKLPLTLAIVEGLLLRVGTQRFVLPTFSIRESLRPTKQQVHSVCGQPRMIRVRDTLMPMVNLAELFGVASTVLDATEATAVVIEDDGRPVALLVDQLLGKQEVVIKSLGEAFAQVKGVAGGAILGDGRVGLILDAGGIVSLMGRSAEAA
jgi:two-component system chemotaxis sensor kinase CheA